MSYGYSNPQRADDPFALPDVEVFYHTHAKRERWCALDADHKAMMYGECVTDADGDCLGSGWYWQSCFPGCLPDGEPIGPFATEAEALADATDNDDFDHELLNDNDNVEDTDND